MTDFTQKTLAALHKSLRSMGLGFSGSQVDWIDEFFVSAIKDAVDEERVRIKNILTKEYQTATEYGDYGRSGVIESIKNII